MTIHDTVPSVQAVRCIYQNGQPASGFLSDIFHLACHPDDSINRDILLWDDILAAFKDEVVHVRLGTRVLPFIKGANFQNLDPLRIAAIPDVRLDVVVRGQSSGKDLSMESPQKALPATHQESNNSSPVSNPSTPTVNLSIPITTIAATARRNPAGGLVEAALQNYTHMENPFTAPKLRGPQSLPSQEAVSTNERAQSRPIASLTQTSAPQEYTNNDVAIDNAAGKGSELFDETIVKARSGDKDAQVSIAEMYRMGREVSQDYEAAMDWYSKAADQGDADAQFSIGFMYEIGHGVPQDYAKAMHWYLKAADQGNASALCNIGYFYDCGHGVDQNYAKAMEWYIKAASQGLAAAQSCIGNLYYCGEGVAQDFSKAMEWYRKAAKRGYANAQDNIGVLYYQGQGVPQDYHKALEWFQKAADQGHSNGKKHVEAVTQLIKDSAMPDVDAVVVPVPPRIRKSMIPEAVAEKATQRTKENKKSLGLLRRLFK